MLIHFRIGKGPSGIDKTYVAPICDSPRSSNRPRWSGPMTDQDRSLDIEHPMLVLGLCYGATLLGLVAALSGIL